MNKKTNAYVCPKCGEEINTDIIDTDICEDNLYLTFSCNHYDAVWQESFKLLYKGYNIDKNFYDENGNEIKGDNDNG